MTLLKTLLVAAAIAMPITATYALAADITAGAGSKGKTSKKAQKSASKASSKSCGTYMYRKDGKCMDARIKK